MASVTRFTLKARSHQKPTNTCRISPISSLPLSRRNNTLVGNQLSKVTLLENGQTSRSWICIQQRGTGRQGEGPMKNIVSSICSHARRMWLARNGCLHDRTNSEAQSTTAEEVESTYYHSNPQLLRLGDQHYCRRSLTKLLRSCIYSSALVTKSQAIHCRSYKGWNNTDHDHTILLSSLSIHLEHPHRRRYFSVGHIRKWSIETYFWTF